MDLGELIRDVGSEYIRAKYQPAFTIPGTNYDISGDIPFIDIDQKPKRRRRRRRLLTATDLNDLALLKTLTGNNAAFNAAVVKAVRR